MCWKFWTFGSGSFLCLGESTWWFLGPSWYFPGFPWISQESTDKTVWVWNPVGIFIGCFHKRTSEEWAWYGILFSLGAQNSGSCAMWTESEDIRPGSWTCVAVFVVVLEVWRVSTYTDYRTWFEVQKARDDYFSVCYHDWLVMMANSTCPFCDPFACTFFASAHSVKTGFNLKSLTNNKQNLSVGPC